MFAALIVLFLQRSTEEVPRDHLWQYLVAGVGCAVCNYLGNEGYVIASVCVLGAVFVFVQLALRPFDKR